LVIGFFCFGDYSRFVVFLVALMRSLRLVSTDFEVIAPILFLGIIRDLLFFSGAHQIASLSFTDLQRFWAFPPLVETAVRLSAYTPSWP